MAKTEPWLVLDTETTGLGEDRELVEVAVVGMEGEIEYQSLVRSSRPMPAAARRVHGIGDDALRGAPCSALVLAELRPRLEGCLVHAFGASFDRRTIELACSLWSLAAPRCRWSCLLDRYRRIRGFEASLRTACEIEGIAVPHGPHRAGRDALLAWQLLLKLQQLSDN